MRAAMRALSPVQWAAIVGALAVLTWSIPGLIVNPDFATGDSATSVRVLGVDMNGWHAVSGFLVAVPVLLVVRRPSVEAPLLLLSAGGLVATAIWALFSTHPAEGLFSFPHNETDALLHFATSTIFVAGAAHYYVIERSRARTLPRAGAVG
jgi:hypothetical protein